MKRARWAAASLALVLAAVATQHATGAQERPGLDISTRARALQPGEVIVLEVACTCGAAAKATARAFDRSLPLFPVPGRSAWSGLIGLDVETRPGSYPISVVVERPNEPALTGAYTLGVKAKQFPTRRLTVAPAFVEPPPEALERISKDAARLGALFRRATPRERVGPFRAPVSAPPGSTFGARSIFNGQARSPHSGVDFGSPTGTPIAAPAPAVVVLADDLYFTGNTLVLDHGLGLYSVLAHLSKMNVADGDRVNLGDIVGAVGATGRVTGPHLHWGARLNGARVDPLSLVEILAP
jgi:hypothetical protein